MRRMKDSQKNVLATLQKISPSFCLAKWNQTTLHLFNGNTQSCHHVLPHRVPRAAVVQHPSALHNSPQKRKVRSKMMKGRFPKECDYCWKIEKSGGTSDRVFKSSADWAWPSFNERAKWTPALDSQVAPTYLEVAFDNICNLKCAYCSPVYSSSWEHEIRQLGAYPTRFRYNNLSLFRLQKRDKLVAEEHKLFKEAFWTWWPELGGKLQHLRVTGGEPLLAADTWKLLDRLKNEHHPQLIFSINSNLSVPEPLVQRLSQSLTAIEDRVEKIIVFASIDSIGKQSEYIRFGLNEQLFWKNIETLLGQSGPSFQLSFMITVNLLSLPGFASLIEKIARLKETYPNRHISIDTPYLNHPEHLSLCAAPEFSLPFIDKAIRAAHVGSFSHEEILRIERIRSLLESGPFPGLKRTLLLRDLHLFLCEYDKRRALNHDDVFPELSPLFHSAQQASQSWWGRSLAWIRV